MRRRPRLAVLLASLVLAGCAGAPGDEGAGGDGGEGGASAAPAWRALAPLPVERTEAVAVAAAGRVWVLGGIFPGAEGVSPAGRVDVYDPANDSWSAGPSLPRPLHHVAAVALEGDRILVTGGFVGGQLGAPQFVPVADTWLLDASKPEAERAWVASVPLPAPRGGHAAATDGRVAWVFGGVGGPPVYLPPGEAMLERSAWRLDLSEASPAWAPIAPFPQPRDHLAGAFLDGKAYAIGGRALTLNKNTARVDVYDPAADAWTQAPDMPTARGGLGAATLGGRVWVAGGESPSAAHREVEAFSPVAGWTREAPLPEARHGVGVAALGGLLYVLGGGPTPAFSYSDTTYALRPAPVGA